MLCLSCAARMRADRIMEITYDEAFGAFYTGIVGYCISQLSEEDPYSEDIASECFVLLYEKWDTFQSHTAVAVQVWLFRAAKNKILDYQKRKRFCMLSIDDEETLEALEKELNALINEIDEREEHERYQMYISEIQNTLDDNEWILFDLVVNRRQSFRQIAEMLDSTESASKMRWHRLRAKLKLVIFTLFRKKEK